MRRDFYILLVQSTELLTVEANDGDYGLRWAIKYTLSDYTDIFSIGETSGILTVRNGSKIDRESDGVYDGVYTLTVTVRFSLHRFTYLLGIYTSVISLSKLDYRR